MEVIDPADQATWPPDVRKEIERLAVRCREHPDNTSETPSYELSLGNVDTGRTAEVAFRDLLGPRPVALFHATRLLPHEQDAILEEGLVVLREDHRSARLDRVIALYSHDVEASRLEALRQSGPLSWNQGHRDGRLGRLFGVTPLQAAFDGAGSDMTVFLDNWGGESFYWAGHDSSPLDETLKLLINRSEPAIVAVGVTAAMLNDYRRLWPIFVAQLDGWPEPWHEFSITESIPPERVVAILGPSSPAWPARYDEP